MFSRDPLFLLDGVHSFADMPEGLSTIRHREVGGSRIRNLEQTPYSLPYWESPYYYNKVERWMQDMRRDGLILDAGCGDGRFTLKLLDLGFERVVSFDANADSLLALRETLVRAGNEHRVTLVHGNVLDPPFRDEIFDAVLCIGVLYYLNNEYENALRQMVRTLKKGGRLLETEPDQQGNAVKALLFDGIQRFLSVTRDKRFLEYFGGKPLELRCFPDSELRCLFDEAGLSVLGVEVLSLLPSLLRIGCVKKIIPDAEAMEHCEDDLRRAFDYYDTLDGPAKHKLWVLEKR